MLTILKRSGLVFAGVGLLVAAGAFAQDSDIAQPGTVNYIEGTALVDDNPLPPRAARPVTVGAGQVLSTEKGKAEMLLTPGIFFRINDNSAVKMVTPNLTHTVVELEKGRAAVEVDQIFPQNEVQVVLQGKTVQLLKQGFYELDADSGHVRTYVGKSAVLAGPGKWIDVKGGKEYGVTSAAKPAGFNKDATHDDLYKWSSLRSEYMSQADGQMSWNGYQTAGWYWNPYFDGYVFWWPGPFWSPFWGWGYYGGGGWYGGRVYRGGYATHASSGSAIGGHAMGGGGFHGGGGGHR